MTESRSQNSSRNALINYLLSKALAGKILVGVFDNCLFVV